MQRLLIPTKVCLNQFFYEAAVRELSVFVDESGNFGMYGKTSPFYVVSFVFHNQAEGIEDSLSGLNAHLQNIGYPNHYFHTEPIIRGEGIYENIPLDDRRKLFDSIVYFAKKCPISHHTFIYRKQQFDSKVDLMSRMSKDISQFLTENLDYFTSFDTVKIYYDDGQAELSMVLTLVLSAVLSNVSFKKVRPSEYRFFQVADLLCTIALTNEKYLANGKLSRSEICIFKNYSNFKKNYLPVLFYNIIS